MWADVNDARYRPSCIAAGSCENLARVTVAAYADRSPAAWLLEQAREWYDLTARGPLDFARYARLRFIPDPAFLGQRESDAYIPDLGGPGPSEIWQIGVAMTHLARHTTTPDECYYLIWEGWPGVRVLCKRARAARIDVNDEKGHSVRGYYLFRGDADLAAWDDGDAGPPFGSSWPIPAFIWPADRTWCVVRDVDPHFATIGASSAAITDILADSSIDAIDDDPTVDPPRYV
ncbi:hypothetical protein O4159_09880 [Gordonia terrae]|uniref:hypothetical protein n=1 Tax=Gordonia hongkongensis TaxID=1701090 RepID=UPI0022B41733|nr:hypothetical protein [Gordonia terrae]